MVKLAGLDSLNSLALIGMSKNAGKTTCLNHIVADWQASGQTRHLALTSIGRDGEAEDILSGRAKPRIYIPAGTIIATAQGALQRCDPLLEILDLSNIRTAFGEVVLCRALSDGYVELAGPSTAEELDVITDLVRKQEPDCLFIIDGALSRRSQAGAGVSEAIILAVSAETSANPEILTEKTRFALEILQTPGLDSDLEQLILTSLQTDPKANVIGIVEKNGLQEISSLNTPSLVGFGKDVAKYLKAGTTTIFLKGAITDQIVSQLLREEKFAQLKLVAEDGTRLFLKPETIRKLETRQIDLFVLFPLDVRLVCLNPTRSNGQSGNRESLLDHLQNGLDLQVVDFGPANM